MGVLQFLPQGWAKDGGGHGASATYRRRQKIAIERDQREGDPARAVLAEQDAASCPAFLLLERAPAAGYAWPRHQPHQNQAPSRLDRTKRPQGPSSGTTWAARSAKFATTLSGSRQGSRASVQSIHLRTPILPSDP